jgi:nicotinate phosphoribosyltransferase
MLSEIRRDWVDDSNAALLTDHYELTMLQAYWRQELRERATFTLFVRRLPRTRNFLLACGVGTVLDWLERFHFGDPAIEALARNEIFDPAFLEWLRTFRFTGSIRALPEGTPFFANEPILEVTAPLPEAQILETFVMNQVHLQTVMASKAARVVHAAAGRTVADFGLRRMHGSDAGMKAARAFYVAGVDATSNVLAGWTYGIPVTGTMAHSYVQAHEREADAFREFAAQYPETILLVDTYDTLAGVRLITELAGNAGESFRPRGIRLDSGDLARLSRESRRILDNAGLHEIKIFASGGLDEISISHLVAGGAPIDGFGVGTGMGVSSDAPSLDIVYKLVEYAGSGRVKKSPGKPVLAGPKQVFRDEIHRIASGDTIGRENEDLPGRPLLVEVMRDGVRLDAGRVPLEESRKHAREQVARLPARIRSLNPAETPYPVAISSALEAYTRAAHTPRS